MGKLWVDYSNMLRSLNSLNQKEALINHDGEIQEREIYFICNNASLVTFGHGTCMHFIQTVAYSAFFRVNPLS